MVAHDLLDRRVVWRGDGTPCQDTGATARKPVSRFHPATCVIRPPHAPSTCCARRPCPPEHSNGPLQYARAAPKAQGRFERQAFIRMSDRHSGRSGGWIDLPPHTYAQTGGHSRSRGRLLCLVRHEVTGGRLHPSCRSAWAGHIPAPPHAVSTGFRGNETPPGDPWCSGGIERGGEGIQPVALADRLVGRGSGGEMARSGAGRFSMRSRIHTTKPNRMITPWNA